MLVRSRAGEHERSRFESSIGGAAVKRFLILALVFSVLIIHVRLQAASNQPKRGGTITLAASKEPGAEKSVGHRGLDGIENSRVDVRAAARERRERGDPAAPRRVLGDI